MLADQMPDEAYLGIRDEPRQAIMGEYLSRPACFEGSGKGRSSDRRIRMLDIAAVHKHTSGMRSKLASRHVVAAPED
jgi:hypothetical protein